MKEHLHSKTMKSNKKKRALVKPKKSAVKAVNVANPALYFATQQELEERNNLEQRIWTWISESEHGFMPNSSSMEKQPFASPKMRMILVDWMFYAASLCNLQRETIHLAVNILDRYFMHNKEATRDNYQIFGIASLWIGAKMEEGKEPRIDTYVGLASGYYSKKELVKTELDILKVLNWKLQTPTICTWVNLFLQNNNRYENKDQFLMAVQTSFGPSVSYLLYYQVMNIAEIALRSSKSLNYSYSLIAASAVSIVLCSRRETQVLSSIVTGFIGRQTSVCIKWMETFDDFPRPYVFNKTFDESAVKGSNYFTIQPYNEKLVNHLKTLKDFA